MEVYESIYPPFMLYSLRSLCLLNASGDNAYGTPFSPTYRYPHTDAGGDARTYTDAGPDRNGNPFSRTANGYSGQAVRICVATNGGRMPGDL